MNSVLERYKGYRSSWLGQLKDLFSYIGYRFGRREMRERALDYLVGLLSTIERKNGWQPAEVAAYAMPYSVQHLLDRAYWDCDALRDDLVDYVAQELGNEDGILVVGETGFLKKGQSLAGAGAKGPFWYEWSAFPCCPGGCLASVHCYCAAVSATASWLPRGTSLDVLVQVAGVRWTIEKCFEAAKGEVGLDQYEVRSWHAWYRHITLSMFVQCNVSSRTLSWCARR